VGETGGDGPEHLSDDRLNGLSAWLHTRSWRHDEEHISTRADLRPDLVDLRGALRLGVVAFAADASTGMQSGLAVLGDDLWVVTADLSVSLAEPVTVGPVRIDSEVVRSGATTVVATLEAWDEGSGRLVGSGSATSRPFPFDFERSWVDFPIGGELSHGRLDPPTDVPLVDRLRIRRVGEDGTMGLDLRPWLLNPWGILHGGATACLAEEAALAAVAGSLGTTRGDTVGHAPPQALGVLLRYLAPGRIGPVLARPRVQGIRGDRAVVRVDVTDEGNGGRPCALATVEVAVG
jgi:acyl-coenzyme A thioesterase PaaI-like protein